MDLCKKVVCTNVVFSGQIAKTWKMAQQATCCSKLQQKNKLPSA